jgi:hypothetical protein
VIFSCSKVLPLPSPIPTINRNNNDTDPSASQAGGPYSGHSMIYGKDCGEGMAPVIYLRDAVTRSREIRDVLVEQGYHPSTGPGAALRGRRDQAGAEGNSRRGLLLMTWEKDWSHRMRTRHVVHVSTAVAHDRELAVERAVQSLRQVYARNRGMAEIEGATRWCVFAVALCRESPRAS